MVASPTTVRIYSVHKTHVLSEEFTKRAKEKIDNKVVRLFPRIYEIELLCDVKDNVHKIKAKLHLPRDHYETISAEGESLYATIDILCARIRNYCAHTIGKITHLDHTRHNGADAA